MARTRKGTGSPGGDLFDSYLDPKRPHAQAYDEMFDADGAVRAAYRRLHESLAPSTP